MRLCENPSRENRDRIPPSWDKLLTLSCISQNGLTLGFDSDPDPNEIILLAKIGYGDSFERGSDAASVKAEFEAEAGAEGGIKYSQGVTRRYAEVGAEVAAEFEAVVGMP